MCCTLRNAKHDMEMQTSLFAELLTATQLLTDGQDLQL